MKSLQGQLLIAVPKLRDPGFFHSVVLLIRHTDEGAFGLTLNRPGDIQLADVWPQFSQTTCHWPQTLFTGGPVSGPLMVLHNEPSAAEMQVIPGLYFTVASETLSVLFANPDALAQFFSGYCGWGAGQLERELEVGSWITVAATAQHVFRADAELWKTVTGELAESAVYSALNIKHTPPETNCN